MDYKRPDGRLPNELRDIIISFDGLDGVDGSARFGFGETKALASISGPMEVRLAVEQASKTTFEVIVRPLAGLPGTDSKALASALRSALLPSMILTNNPRTLLQLVALSLTPVPSVSSLTLNDLGRGRGPSTLLLRTGPSLVASLINASTLALLNASSIPLRGVVCAVSVGRVRSTTRGLVVDPSEDELAKLDGAGAFAFLIAGDTNPSLPSIEQEKNVKLKAELVWSQWNATPFDEDELARATELARVGALRVREHMKEAIEKHVLGSKEVKKEEEITGSNLKNVKVEEQDDEKMEIS